MSLCNTIQDRLAGEGLALADSDANVRKHLQTCAHCMQVLHELRHLDAALPELTTHDATDELVARSLQAVRRAASPPKAPARSRYTRDHLAAGLAASVVLIASFSLTFDMLESPGPMLSIGTEMDGARSGVDFTDSFSRAKDLLATGRVAKRAQSPQSLHEVEVEGPVSALPAAGMVAPKLDPRGIMRPAERQTFEVPAPAKREQSTSMVRERLEERRRFDYSIADKPVVARDADGLDDGRKVAESGVAALLEVTPQEQKKERVAGNESNRRIGDKVGATRGESGDEQLQRRAAAKSQQITPALSARPRNRVAADLKSPRHKSKLRKFVQPRSHALPASERDNVAASSIGGGAGAATGARIKKTVPRRGPMLSNAIATARRATTGDPHAARTRARNFLQSYQSLDGLSFQAASGYWSNSYLPGDPAMRLFQARLRDWNRAALGANARLEQAVSPVRQPFDAPQGAAMALYLEADTPAITAPTRLRVQVGLKGAERQGGHRPAMNIALVLDLRSAPDAETSARMRALILALQQARQPEDRFSLTVAGPAGGLLVPADQFRHGPLRVVMERLFGAPRGAGRRATQLPQALAAAAQSVREGDDTKGVLGSSLLLLVTASSLSIDLTALERQAHRNAISGVALSVVSLGGEHELDHIDRLVAAGQGNRRILDSAQAADALVDRELHSASRAIARALRLRIRLAPGVKLINVLGSHPLAAPDAERVREAEQAIDKRLARNLGIQSDRGEDEEGIQIVIPNFYAGDAHVILLDVLVQRAGPIADVTLRYKDVVYLRNGVTHANLTIDDSVTTRSPLQDNVVKNLMALEFARQIRAVSRDLAARNSRRAATRLAALRDLVHGLRLEVRGWQSDADLIADEVLLSTYLSVLDTPVAGDVAHRRHLADSLQYAAFRKLQPSAP